MDFFILSLILIFLAGIFFAYLIGYKNGAFRKNREWEKEMPSYRKDAILKSRAILSGQFSEQLAPFLPEFHFSPEECRFIGKPIDFIVFDGMNGKKINEIVFVEVKSGDSKLNSTEKSLKEAVENKKVRWEEYRISRELTSREGFENI